ncbi:MAG TPA: hypothetical protein VJ869_04345 [Sphaerochaeta sp.]|nr:hypothetical protein [Sphaerochaeta sp.]
MEAVFILIVIFSFIIIISTLDEKFKMNKRKMDAALRMREMESGYPPGTYSGYSHKYSKRKRSKDNNFPSMEEASKESQRELLKKGIDDLQQRLDNIETIMQSRKAQEKEYKE